jgi:hypothetical protein
MNTDSASTEQDEQPDTKQSEGTPKRHPIYGTEMPDEIAGPRGPEPTRYGDWEVKGRCSDF